MDNYKVIYVSRRLWCPTCSRSYTLNFQLIKIGYDGLTYHMPCQSVMKHDRFCMYIYG